MHNEHKDASLNLVSCEWLHGNLSRDNLVILDASVNSESHIHIPNARPLDVKGKFSNAEAPFPNTIPSQDQFQKQARVLGVNTDSYVVVYDDKGMYWSPRIWWLFKTFGFEKVAVLDGGLPEWKRLGFQTHTIKPKHNSWTQGDFVANYQANHMMFYSDICTVANNMSYQIIDARSESRFQCVEPEPRAGLRSGTIPNSENLHYKRLLNGFCLKPKQELEAIFQNIEVEHKHLVFSCGSGITACILALAATIINHKSISVYDGSWTEYGTLTKPLHDE